jgi:hypothetical protein
MRGSYDSTSSQPLVAPCATGSAGASCETPETDRPTPLKRQVSAKANFSSNIPMRWIDSWAKRSYSLAQIPNLVAYTNPRLRRKARIQGKAVRRFRQTPTGIRKPVLSLHTNLCIRMALAPSAPGADEFLILMTVPGAAPWRRSRFTSISPRAGGRQIL